MDGLQSIFSRRSIRKYKVDVAVSDEALDNILKAGCSAPSAHNGRPWEFIVVRNRETIEKLSKVKKYYKAPLNDAPMAIAVLLNPNTNEKVKLAYKYQDCSAAMQNMLVAASAQGLGSCWMGGLLEDDEMKKINEILGLSDDIIFFGLLSVGVADEEKKPKGWLEESKIHYEKY